MKPIPTALLFLLLLGAGAGADVRMPAVFGDHMVLQQELKIPVWGWAEPGEKIQVHLGSEDLQAEANANGEWRVEFPPRPTSDQPTTLSITGKNSLQFQDVVIGEVWLASGQSNMSYPLLGSKGGKEAAEQATDALLRVYDVENHPALRPNLAGKGHWTVCTPAYIGNTSAVAFYFGRALREKLHRPVGLMEASWGGTPIETWMSAAALEKIPGSGPKLAEIQKESAAFPTDPAQQKPILDDWSERLRAWEAQLRTFQEAEKKWRAEVEAARAAHQPLPPAPARLPERPRNPGGQEGDYTTLYNGMIAGVAGYAMRGVIWYQGEANTGSSQAQYEALLRGLIEDWRAHWGSEFSFLVVGLANCGDREPMHNNDGWAEVRGAQAAVTAGVPHTGLAQAIDVGCGHNIHPIDKLDVGLRLAASAQHVSYGQSVPFDGPRFAGMSREGNKIRVKYAGAESGLKLAHSPFVSDDAMFDNPALPTVEPLAFEVAGADRKWVSAKAAIDGSDILVWSDGVADPAAVRFAWACNPPVNLYNKDGFPAVPFRTENWPSQPRR